MSLENIENRTLDSFESPAQLAREVTEAVIAGLPQEKLEAEQAMIRTAQELQARGSDHVDGRGQAIGSIPPRIYMRWQQLLPGCWQDREFVSEFLHDNPQCRAPGYTPRPRNVGRGFRMGVDFYAKHKDSVKA